MQSLQICTSSPNMSIVSPRFTSEQILHSCAPHAVSIDIQSTTTSSRTKIRLIILITFFNLFIDV